MIKIGLTGPSGAGKGLVSSCLSPYGIPSIDTDRVYHDLLVPPSPCLVELVGRFGNDILSPNGTLNRKALAGIVFAEGHEQDHADLNRITHKYVLEATRRICRELAERGTPCVLIDAPLLFEAGFDAECDATLAVLASPDIRLCRIMARDHLTLAEAKARLMSQKPDDFYISRATYVIYNNGTPADIQKEVEALIKRLGGDNI